MLVSGLLIFQTPLVPAARGWVWDVWVNSIGRITGVGTLRLDQDVLGQLQKLQSENARLTTQLRRFERLERQLGSSNFADFRQIPATVSARPIDTFASQYVVNKGTGDGVTAGAPVTVYGSTLVGFVTELSARSSLVTLLVNPIHALPAEVLGEEAQTAPVRGLAQGSHFTSVLLTTVPRDQKVAAGMRIVTVSQEQKVPGGLAIGSVAEVLSSERDAYQSATIALPYDPGGLEAVSILVPLPASP